MAEFRSANEYWDFARSVRLERRYHYRPTTHRFLEAVRATAATRFEDIEKGTSFWRAQLGCRWESKLIPDTDDSYDEEAPFDAARMTPSAEHAKEGRANPKGMPVLYLCSHRDTAVAEVRAWKHSVATVASFIATRQLRMINMTNVTRHGFHIGAGEPVPAVREEYVWAAINRAFRQPVTANDSSTEYVPTQVLAELLRDMGADGILYESSYGEGHNVALFDLGAAVQGMAYLVRVVGMKLTLEDDTSNMYKVRRDE